MVNDRKPIKPNFTHNQGEILGNEKGCLDISNSNSNMYYFIIPKGLSQEIEF